MASKNFKLSDLYPKFIINSSGEKKAFDESKIAIILNKETGLDFKIAQEIAEKVIRRIIGMKNEVIHTNYLRELICVELTERELHHHRNLFSKPINFTDIGFKLNKDFFVRFEGIQPDWGPLGYVVYKRTYSRLIEDQNRKEEFWETIKRVVEGCFSIQKEHCKKLGLPWDENEAQTKAQKMYSLIWEFKFLPPGRGLWMMGTEYIQRRGSMALNNCGFVSTEDIIIKGSKAFKFVMDAMMLGVGVGFDTKGAKKLLIKEPQPSNEIYQIPDSREGWIEALGMTIDAYFFGSILSEIDYSLIRPAGSLIRGFGGVASGSEPLKYMLNEIKQILENRKGDYIQSLDIIDIMNHIGKCVVAGNIRRSAEIALGDPNDKEFLFAKQDEKKLYSHRWASNNTVFATKGMDYSLISEQIKINGEPGVFWLENARAFSRMDNIPDFKDKKVAGVNPCSEQSLESLELCVRGNTRVHTINGCYKIKNIEGTFVKVWNGKFWSVVKVVMTSKKSELIRVYFSDGSYLDTTKYHKFSSKGQTKRIYRKVKAIDLNKGDMMPEWNLGKINGNFVPNAYEYGVLIGDGYISEYKNKYESKLYPMVCLYGDHMILLEKGLKGSVYKTQYNKTNLKPYVRVNMKDYLDVVKSYNLRKFDGLEDWIFEMDRKSILELLGGWIDTDGSIMKQKNTYHYRLYGTEQNLRDLQFLLRRVNINHSTIRLMKKKGEHLIIKGINTIRKKDLWYLTIPSYECIHIPCRQKIIPINKIGNRLGINYRHPDGRKIDRSRKQRIIKVQMLNIEESVYCFNEEENHMAVFNNTLTYQCNLAETFPSRHESYEEFQETLKYAYIYAKSVTLINTHWPETNAVMLKNRRIGISQTGIIEAFIKHGRRTMLEWSDKGYQFLRELDEEYSNWLCIPRSIKITTVKPSGSVSLLAGVTPGIHYPHSKYYIRRVRIAKNSDLIPHLRSSGYEIEDDITNEKSYVVSFPMKEKNFERSKNDVSIWEQTQNAADYQKYWSDNQISITVSFKPEEENEIKRVLECFEDKLKSISFLPLRDHGYKQAPYEEITKKAYEEMIGKINQLDLKNSKDDAKGEKFCNTDKCLI